MVNWQFNEWMQNSRHELYIYTCADIHYTMPSEQNPLYVPLLSNLHKACNRHYCFLVLCVFIGEELLRARLWIRCSQAWLSLGETSVPSANFPPPNQAAWTHVQGAPVLHSAPSPGNPQEPSSISKHYWGTVCESSFTSLATTLAHMPCK